jgi:hypothetical protein
MNKFNRFAIATIIAVALASLGCAGRAQEPRSPEPKQEEPAEEVTVEGDSAVGLAVRSGRATKKAAEDTWDWAAEKKREAKAWLHEATEEENDND